MIAILALASFRLREGKIRLGGVTEYLFFGILAAGWPLSGRWNSFSAESNGGAGGSGAGRRYVPLARALVVALPLLVLFASLLASADEVFSNALTGAVAFDLGMGVTHAVRAMFWAWLAAGFFHGVLFDSSGPVPQVAPPA